MASINNTFHFVNNLSEVKTEILSRLNIVDEYKSLGLRIFSTGPNRKGWLTVRAMDREDAKPSAGINILTGRYKDFGSGENLSLFDFATKYAPGHFPNFFSALSFFAEKTGVALPAISPLPSTMNKEPSSPPATSSASSTPPSPAPAWSARADKYHERMLNTDAAPTIAKELGISVDALNRINAGTYNSGPWAVNTPLCWPEFDCGRVVGIGTRAVEFNPATGQNKKVRRCVLGSCRGLILPRGWLTEAKESNTLYIVEGITDVLAGVTLGLPVIGIPMAGFDANKVVKNLQYYIVDANIKVTIIADGDVVGRQGALGLAETLKIGGYANVETKGIANHKDLRAWLNNRNLNHNILYNSFIDVISEPSITHVPIAVVDTPIPHADYDFGPTSCSHTIGIHLANGSIHKAVRVRCKCWKCEGCSAWLKTRWAKHINNILGETKTWLYSVPKNEWRKFQRKCKKNNIKYIRFALETEYNVMVNARLSWSGEMVITSYNIIHDILKNIYYSRKRCPIKSSPAWELPAVQSSEDKMIGKIRHSIPKIKQILEEFRVPHNAIGEFGFIVGGFKFQIPEYWSEKKRMELYDELHSHSFSKKKKGIEKEMHKWEFVGVDSVDNEPLYRLSG